MMVAWWHDYIVAWYNMIYHKWYKWYKYIYIKDDDFMMTWCQTWLEGKTRWPLVDWGAVRDSVLEEDRCCTKRYLANSKTWNIYIFQDILV